MMNLAANMLGLDNAATPLGLKAMTELQEINKEKDTASNAMIMFLVLNASGLTIIPVSIMVYRAQLGAANPSDVFIPILLATFFSTLTGIIAVSLFQRINLLNRVVLAYLGGFTLLVSGIIWYFSTISQEQINTISSVAGNFILFLIIVSFIILAFFKKVNVYETFIDGAKDGFSCRGKDHPLPGGDPCRRWCFPHFRCDGLPGRRDKRPGGFHGRRYPLRGCAARRPL